MKSLEKILENRCIRNHKTMLQAHEAEIGLPDCGTKQALDTVRDLLGPEMTDQQWEGYKSGFLKRSREGQHGQNTL